MPSYPVGEFRLVQIAFGQPQYDAEIFDIVGLHVTAVEPQDSFMAMKPVRLLPSENGWLRTMPKP